MQRAPSREVVPAGQGTQPAKTVTKPAGQISAAGSAGNAGNAGNAGKAGKAGKAGNAGN